MELIFNDQIICPDISIARKLAFNRDVSCVCVSLEGDIANPAGTMEGGSTNRRGRGPLESYMIYKDAARKYGEIR
eukprot:UN07004